MYRNSVRFLLLSVLVYSSSQHQHKIPPPKATVELNEYSFKKLTSKFEASLIKFDVAYPYGDKHEAFVDVAKDAVDEEELFVAEVGVKDYGTMENEGLAREHGASKENFPLVKLFIRGKTEPYVFDNTIGFTSDNLRKFVRQHTGLYLSLPGCVRELDMLAADFMKADGEKRRNILQEVTNFRMNETNKQSASAKHYETVMEKIFEKGDGFAKSESLRLKKLLGGKLSEDKKNQLNVRLNVLQAFQNFDTVKDEL